MKQVFDAKVIGTLLTYKCQACQAYHQHGYGGPDDGLLRWSHCPMDDYCAIQIHVTALI